MVDGSARRKSGLRLGRIDVLLTAAEGDGSMKRSGRCVRLAVATSAAAAVWLASAGCAGLDPLSRAATGRLDAFDFYWQQLADDYPLFGPRAIDWQELRQRYRAAVPFAQRPHEFYHLLTGMLSELADVHVSFEAPAERWRDEGTAPTSLLELDGFRLMPIEGRLHVVAWPPAGAPMPPDGGDGGYPELRRVEGFPVVLSLVDNLLAGPPGTPVELQLKWRNGALTRHVLRRPAAGGDRRSSALGHLSRPNGCVRRSCQPFTWLELNNLDDTLPLDAIDAVIDNARSSDGLVIDLRANLGGRWDVAQRFVERFLPGPVDLVLAPPHPTSTFFGLFEVEVFVQSQWQPRPPVFDRPVAVLTSALTGSAAEHAARVLQRYAGARLIGERTAGAEAAIQEAIGPDGGRLRFGSTRVLDRTGVGLQEEGVAPDVAVRLTLAEVEQRGAEAAIRDWEQRLLTAARSALAMTR
jgi:C-terminal processing protease CtpA/Prc